MSVLILHGLGAHGAFPTIRLLAEALVSDNVKLAAHSFDYEGCGDSDGLPGFIENVDFVCADARYLAAKLHSPVFLLGSSLGGGLALLLCIETPQLWRGAVLFSPLVVIAEAAKPPQWAVTVLTALAFVAPKLALLGGSNSDASAQYGSSDMRDACELDDKRYRGRMRLGTAAALIALSEKLEASLGRMRLPFIAYHGTSDTIVDISSSRRLLQEAASVDKQLVEYDGAKHTLLAEPEARRGKMLASVSSWLAERSIVKEER
jgi:acylglycerol lipase